jgi:hypothetical protein
MTGKTQTGAHKKSQGGSHPKWGILGRKNLNFYKFSVSVVRRISKNIKVIQPEKEPV